MCFVVFGCLIGPFGPDAIVHVANSFNSIQFNSILYDIVCVICIIMQAVCLRVFACVYKPVQL